MQSIQGHVFKNWSKTYSCQPELYFEPDCAEDLRQVLAKARSASKHVKVIGCGHSPSDIPCTQDYMVSLRKMRQFVGFEKSENDRYFARVQAGMRLDELNDHLHSKGLEFPVQGSIGNITIGGMVSTGTHGSSSQHGNVCSMVRGLQLMAVSGEIFECSRTKNPDLFMAATCGLGAVGILLEVTLECEAARSLKSRSYGATLDEALASIEERQKICQHFEFFWFPHTGWVRVLELSHTTEAPRKSHSWFWDYLIGFHFLHFIMWLSSFASFLVPWINRVFFNLLFKPERINVDRSYRALHFECYFSQHVSEWSIPKEHVRTALYELRDYWQRSGHRAHFPIEVRFVKGDDIWLSPAHGGDRCYINIISYRPYGKEVPHQDYFDAFEDIMFRLGGRPHWAKTHKLHANQLRSLYPKWDDFHAARKALDPQGLLMNRYLEQVFN